MTPKIFHYPVIDSTNDEAKRLAAQGEGFPFVVTADRQTKGRGREGRVWYSESDGGLYYSLCLKPEGFVWSEVQNYVQETGKALIRVIKELAGVDVDMEWPNDLILKDKKLGGILLETHSMGNEADPRYLIAGIGLNLNQHEFPSDLRSVAISLLQVSGQSYNKRTFSQTISRELIHVFTRYSGCNGC